MELEDAPDNPLDLFNPSIRAVENAIAIRLANPTSDELPAPHHSILACIQPSERLLKRSRAQYEALASEARTTKGASARVPDDADAAVPPKTKRGKGQRNDGEVIDVADLDGLGEDGPMANELGVFELQSQFKQPAPKPAAATPFSGSGNVLGRASGSGAGTQAAPMDVDGDDSDKTEDEDEAPPPPAARAPPSRPAFAESQLQPSQPSVPRIKISSDFPVREFQNAWHKAPTAAQKNEIWRACVSSTCGWIELTGSVADAIVQMVAKSFAWSRYPLALDALAFARQFALENGYVEEYLSLIQALRAEHHVDEAQTRRMQKKNFWRWCGRRPWRLG